MHKVTILIVLLQLAVSCLIAQQPFVPAAPFVGEMNGSYIDPEFSAAANQVVFQDYQNRLWIGDLDPATGFFKTRTGCDYLIDDNLPLVMGDKSRPELKFATNGPEWTIDHIGPCVVYTRLDQDGFMQQHMARLINGMPYSWPLTRGNLDCYRNMPSRFQDGRSTRISFTYDWPIWNAKAAWIYADSPSVFHTMPGFDYRRMSMWSAVSADFLFVYRRDSASYGQIARADANTGTITVLTNDEGEKDDPGFFRAPEYEGEICLLANVSNRALAIYRNVHSPDSVWERAATLTLPVESPYRFLSSPEPIAPETGIAGTSYFALLGRTSSDRSSAGSIWILGLGIDPDHRFIRRIDDGAMNDEPAVRLEPEPYVGRDEVYVYYNYYNLTTGDHGLRRARTGINVRPVTRIEMEGTNKPVDLLLDQNYPNPFNPRTVIPYTILVAGYISLKVYDVLGREVQTLVSGFKDAGFHTQEFWVSRAQDAGGIYFCQLRAGGVVQTRKMLLVQ